MAPSWLTPFFFKNEESSLNQGWLSFSSTMLPGQGSSYCSSSLWTLFLLKMPLIFLHFHFVPLSFLLEGHTFTHGQKKLGFGEGLGLHQSMHLLTAQTLWAAVKFVSKVGLDLKSGQSLLKHQDTWNMHLHCAKLGPEETDMEGMWFSIWVV